MKDTQNGLPATGLLSENFEDLLATEEFDPDALRLAQGALMDMLGTVSRLNTNERKEAVICLTEGKEVE